MANVYDNWERLVRAVLRREELWKMFHDRSPSVSSVSSDFSLDSELLDEPFDFSDPGTSPSYEQLPLPGVEDLQKIERSVQNGAPGLVFIGGYDPVFDLEPMLRSTAEFLGKGTFGSSYMSEMDNGLKVVVKRLNVVNILEKKFKQYMEVIGNVRHENVSPLKAYYFSKDEKLMVYDHYDNGSVSALLHGKTGENQVPLDWETRLKIAVGAARGIAHIHKQSGGKLVHGNIKSLNIFLNSEQYGCISDLGLASMMPTPVKQSDGYHAPEVKNTRNVMQASDVYSYGIFLLELLTRKSPLVAIGGNEAVDLVKLVNSANGKEGTANVFDVELLRNRDIEKQVVKTLEIGMSCVAKPSRKRPKMDQVAEMMKDICLMNTRNRLLSKFVLIRWIYRDFDLEGMLRAPAEVLGRGTFGTSYKATLENGTTVVVKRLRDVIATSTKFQRQMKVIGEMRTKNIATLMAFHYSPDERLMVYSDYYVGGSVSSMLHGKVGGNRISLDWETRLRIAIGAAKGIAYIHGTRVGKNFLVHGNVRASNIFLNAQGYGCVSDVGLATLVSMEWVLRNPSSGYLAPEVIDTKKLSQSSDVYSFGVVLLELITGKPAEDVDLARWVTTVIPEEWTAEVFDIELLSVLSFPAEVFDIELLSVLSFPDEEQMMAFLGIALGCVGRVPKYRPKMSHVVGTLENISRGIYTMEQYMDTLDGLR